jgi:hypothetical protein
MLPLDVPRDSNFFPGVIDEVDFRLAQRGWGGLISPDRLFRNLLSSQPATFNVFGYLKHHPVALLAWIRSLGVNAAEVTDVRIEWAPARPGGSAFDAAIFYRPSHSDGRGLVGVECKYAENLDQQNDRPGQIDDYDRATRSNGLWRPGAAERLHERRLVQLWLNALLAQSCAIEGDERIVEATVVMMSLAADRAALDATARVQAELVEPNWGLTWSPYEALLAAVPDDPETERWADWIRRRYLDFTPVADAMAPDDPRQSDDPLRDAARHAVDEMASQYGDAQSKAERVLSDGSVLEQLVDSDPTLYSPSTVLMLGVRLAETAETLRRTREVAAPTHERLWNQQNELSDPGGSPDGDDPS